MDIKLKYNNSGGKKAFQLILLSIHTNWSSEYFRNTRKARDG